MQSVSDQFLSALRSHHNITSTATLSTPSGGTLDLPIQDGTVTIDRTADHRRSLDLTISDPTLYPDQTTDPLNVYGQEIAASRGIEFANAIAEDAALGRFRLEDAGRDLPGGGVAITGWDRSRQLLDERFLAPRKFTAQTAVSLIQLLITEVYPTAAFNVTTLDATTIPKHVVDRDRLPEIQRIAAVIGVEVFVDQFGVWVIQDVPSLATAIPVWTVDSGESGVLVTASDKVSREGAPNIVVALGESVSGNNPPVRSAYPHGYDVNPASPTFVGTVIDPNIPTFQNDSAYGQVPRFYSSPLITTQTQANKVADSQLADHLGASRTIDFTAIPNPALDVGDAIIVSRPDGTSELHIIDQLVIPFTTQGDMTGSTRALSWDAV